ncbi:MAG: hypothetical protein KC419_16595 [Anaerolineales bacterium]|nr:hypothetical protein [Anaerolineales bacterium]MCA9930105.1 hypothetical protein [Anaerolineales bacterium]
MKKKWSAFFVVLSFWLIVTAPALAQTPRPTPTNVAVSQSDPRGAIFGSVYFDVNGDGNCVNTGVEGELPAAGVTLQFTSSDAATVLHLTTGTDGTFGLVAAGESYWEVLVVPDTDMIVTSENPRYVPVYAADTLNHSGINFCVATGANAVIVFHDRTGTTTQTNAVILAPEAGAAAAQSSSTTMWFVSAAGVGFMFILLGLGIELERRRK